MDYVTKMGEAKNAYEKEISGKRPLETSRRRWKDNMRMDLRVR
jgi:hypothetical protein